jgi:hypothetical protein
MFPKKTEKLDFHLKILIITSRELASQVLISSGFEVCRTFAVIDITYTCYLTIISPLIRNILQELLCATVFSVLFSK